MAKTYEPIATTTLGSAAASYTFSSISGSYTDLVLVNNAITATANDNLVIQFNGDTGANYSATVLSGTGSVANSNRQTSGNFSYITYYGYQSTTTPSSNILSIQNYSNTTTYKTFLSRAGQTSTTITPGTDAIVGLWRSTTAITSITLKLAGGTNIASGSIFTLYGVKSA